MVRSRVRDVRVLFFGDSLVAGVGDETGLGWVGRSVAAAHAAGIALTPYNLGVRRDTSRDILSRWENEARPRLAVEATMRVVFSFGANDTTIEGGRLRVRRRRLLRTSTPCSSGPPPWISQRSSSDHPRSTMLASASASSISRVE